MADDVTCGNPQHPDGAWHPAAFLPYPCWYSLHYWTEAFRQWRNRKRWGCSCYRRSDRG